MAKYSFNNKQSKVKTRSMYYILIDHGVFLSIKLEPFTGDLL